MPSRFGGAVTVFRGAFTPPCPCPHPAPALRGRFWIHSFYQIDQYFCLSLIHPRSTTGMSNWGRQVSLQGLEPNLPTNWSECWIGHHQLQGVDHHTSPRQRKMDLPKWWWPSLRKKDARWKKRRKPFARLINRQLTQSTMTTVKITKRQKKKIKKRKSNSASSRLTNIHF